MGDDPRPRTRGRNVEEFRAHVDIRNADPSSQSIGLFDRLPMEIMDEILPNIDVCSLVAFRDINRRTKFIVDSLPMFKLVVSFPGLIYAVLELQCRFFSLGELVRCIHNPKCHYCDHFGDMLYLITARRMCYPCWTEKENVPMIIPFELDNEEQVTSRIAIKLYGHVPHILLSPGTYGVRGAIGFNRPRVAFDQRGFQADPETPSWEITRAERRPHTLSHMVTIRAPYFENSTGTWEEGFMCRACAYEGWDYSAEQVWEHDEYYDAWPQWEMRNWDSDTFASWGVPWRRYTISGMHDHIMDCGEILSIHGDDGRSRYIHEKPPTSMVKNPPGLPEISEMLRLCRDKAIIYPRFTMYSVAWNSVSSIRRTKDQLLADIKREEAQAHSKSQAVGDNL